MLAPYSAPLAPLVLLSAMSWRVPFSTILAITSWALSCKMLLHAVLTFDGSLAVLRNMPFLLAPEADDFFDLLLPWLFQS